MLRSLAMVFVVAVASPGAIFAQEVGPKNRELLKAVISAWKAREARIKTCDFRFTVDKFQSKYSLALFAKRPTPEGLEDVRLSFSARLVVDAENGRLRLENHGDYWSPLKKEVITQHRIVVWTPETEKSFFDEDDERNGFVSIRRADDPMFMHNLIGPVLFVLRPFAEPVQLEASRLTLVSSKASIDGKEMVMLKYKTDFSNYIIWADPKRDYVPVRLAVHGATAHRVAPFQRDYEYKHDEDYGWIPMAWKDVDYTLSGGVFASQEAKVTDYRISQPVADSLFDIDFPPGTLVHDRINGTEYEVGVIKTWHWIAGGIGVAMCLLVVGYFLIRLRRRAAGTVACLALVVAFNPAFAGNPRLQHVLNDWHARRQRTSTVAYHLKGHRFTPKGVFSGDPIFDPGEVVPAQDHVGELEYNTIIDFNRGWFANEKRFLGFRAEIRKWSPIYWLVTFDGEEARHFEPREELRSPDFTPSPAHPDLRRSKAKLSDLTLVFGIFHLPIFATHGLVPSGPKAALLPDRKYFPLTEKRFRWIGTENFGGSSCEILRSVTPEGVSYEYWVDPAKESAILRARVRRDDQMIGQIDADYQKLDWGWVPASWSFAYFPDGRNILYSESVTCRKVVVNARFEKADFQGTIRPGMVIKDYDRGKYYQVQSDGTWEEVSERELLRPGALGPTRISWTAVVVAAVVIVVIGLFGCWLRNRRYQRA